MQFNTTSAESAFSDASLCPECDAVFNPQYLMEGCCPRCGAFIGYDCSVFAVNKSMSHESARRASERNKRMKEQRKNRRASREEDGD